LRIDIAIVIPRDGHYRSGITQVRLIELRIAVRQLSAVIDHVAQMIEERWGRSYIVAGEVRFHVGGHVVDLSRCIYAAGVADGVEYHLALIKAMASADKMLSSDM
jgi:hypothetical protein